MKTAVRMTRGTLEPELSRDNVHTRRYTEEDISALENGDLTDPMVQMALDIAYEQNDPEEDDRIVFQRSPLLSATGTVAELHERLGMIEAKRRKAPRDAYLRKQRAAILCSLAHRRKRGGTHKGT